MADALDRGSSPIAHEREEGGGRDGDDGVAPRVALNADEAAVVAAAGVGGVGFVEAFREGQHAATLRWTLPEFGATRARQLWGDAKDVGGHECRLLVYPKGDTAALPGYSSVFLEMRAKAPAARADSGGKGRGAPGNWECFAWYALTVVHPTDPTKNRTRQSYHRFSATKKSHGWCDFAVIDPEFLLDGVVLVCADIVVLSETAELSRDDLPPGNPHLNEAMSVRDATSSTTLGLPAGAGKEVTSGRFQWTIHNFNAFRAMMGTHKIVSPKFPAGDCHFAVAAYQTFDRPVDERDAPIDGARGGTDRSSLSVQLESKDDGVSGGGLDKWAVSALGGEDGGSDGGGGLSAEPSAWLLFRVSLVNQVDSKKTAHRDTYGRFASGEDGGDHTSLGWNDFLDMSRLDDPEEGFSTGAAGKVTLAVTFYVIRESHGARPGFPLTPKIGGLPLSSTMAWMTDELNGAPGSISRDGGAGGGGFLGGGSSRDKKIHHTRKGGSRHGHGGVDGDGAYRARFVWKIDNFTKLKDLLKKRKMNGLCVKSKRFVVGGKDCRVVIYPRGQQSPATSLSMFLEVTNVSERRRRPPTAGKHNWSVFVSHRMGVLNHHDASKSVIRESQNRYGRSAKDWGWREFLPLTSLFDNDAGFLDPARDRVVFVAEVLVLKEHSELKKMDPTRVAGAIMSFEDTLAGDKLLWGLGGSFGKNMKTISKHFGERVAVCAKHPTTRCEEWWEGTLQLSKNDRVIVLKYAARWNDEIDDLNDVDAHDDGLSDHTLEKRFDADDVVNVRRLTAEEDGDLLDGADDAVSKLRTPPADAPGRGVNVDFTWKIENVSAFRGILETRKLFSRFFPAGGVNLRLGAYESFDTLCVYLESDQGSTPSAMKNKTTPPGGGGGGAIGEGGKIGTGGGDGGGGGDGDGDYWVRYRVAVTNQKHPDRTKWKDATTSSKRWTSNVIQFMPTEDLTHPEGGYLVKDSIALAVEVLDVCYFNPDVDDGGSGFSKGDVAGAASMLPAIMKAAMNENAAEALSSASDAFQLHPDVRSYGTTLSASLLDLGMSGADVKDTFRTAAEHFNLDDCDVDELLHAVATSAAAAAGGGDGSIPGGGGVAAAGKDAATKRLVDKLGPRGALAAAAAGRLARVRENLAMPVLDEQSHAQRLFHAKSRVETLVSEKKLDLNPTPPEGRDDGAGAFAFVEEDLEDFGDGKTFSPQTFILRALIANALKFKADVDLEEFQKTIGRWSVEDELRETFENFHGKDCGAHHMAITAALQLFLCTPKRALALLRADDVFVVGTKPAVMRLDVVRKAYPKASNDDSDSSLHATPKMIEKAREAREGTAPCTAPFSADLNYNRCSPTLATLMGVMEFRIVIVEALITLLWWTYEGKIGVEDSGERKMGDPAGALADDEEEELVECVIDVLKRAAYEDQMMGIRRKNKGRTPNNGEDEDDVVYDVDDDPLVPFSVSSSAMAMKFNALLSAATPRLARLLAQWAHRLIPRCAHPMILGSMLCKVLPPPALERFRDVEDDDGDAGDAGGDDDDRSPPPPPARGAADFNDISSLSLDESSGEWAVAQVLPALLNGAVPDEDVTAALMFCLGAPQTSRSAAQTAAAIRRVLCAAAAVDFAVALDGHPMDAYYAECEKKKEEEGRSEKGNDEMYEEVAAEWEKRCRSEAKQCGGGGDYKSEAKKIARAMTRDLLVHGDNILPDGFKVTDALVGAMARAAAKRAETARVLLSDVDADIAFPLSRGGLADSPPDKDAAKDGPASHAGGAGGSNKKEKGDSKSAKATKASAKAAAREAAREAAEREADRKEMAAINAVLGRSTSSAIRETSSSTDRGVAPDDSELSDDASDAPLLPPSSPIVDLPIVMAALRSPATREAAKATLTTATRRGAFDVDEVVAAVAKSILYEKNTERFLRAPPSPSPSPSPDAATTATTAMTAADADETKVVLRRAFAATSEDLEPPSPCAVAAVEAARALFDAGHDEGGVAVLREVAASYDLARQRDVRKMLLAETLGQIDEASDNKVSVKSQSHGGGRADASASGDVSCSSSTLTLLLAFASELVGLWSGDFHAIETEADPTSDRATARRWFPLFKQAYKAKYPNIAPDADSKRSSAKPPSPEGAFEALAMMHERTARLKRRLADAKKQADDAIAARDAAKAKLADEATKLGRDRKAAAAKTAEAERAVKQTKLDAKKEAEKAERTRLELCAKLREVTSQIDWATGEREEKQAAAARENAAAEAKSRDADAAVQKMKAERREETRRAQKAIEAAATMKREKAKLEGDVAGLRQELESARGELSAAKRTAEKAAANAAAANAAAANAAAASSGGSDADHAVVRAARAKIEQLEADLSLERRRLAALRGEGLDELSVADLAGVRRTLEEGVRAVEAVTGRLAGSGSPSSGGGNGGGDRTAGGYGPGPGPVAYGPGTPGGSPYAAPGGVRAGLGAPGSPSRSPASPGANSSNPNPNPNTPLTAFGGGGLGGLGSSFFGSGGLGNGMWGEEGAKWR